MTAQGRGGKLYVAEGFVGDVVSWKVEPAPDPDAPFLAAIDARPGDMLPLRIWADFLEERGDERAEALRWAAETGKVPEWPFDACGWICVDYPTVGESLAGCGLPWWLGKHLRGKNYDRTCKRISAAYRELCRAWLACRHAGIDPLTGEKNR